MHVATAWIGAALVFFAVLIAVGFVTVHVVEGFSGAYQLLALGTSLAIALVAGISSYRATLRAVK